MCKNCGNCKTFKVDIEPYMIICQVCGKTHDHNKVVSFYGKDSLISMLRLCSARCYENRSNLYIKWQFIFDYRK